MNDVIDAVTSRFKSPYFGYALLAFFALNWRGIFLLIVTDGTPNERLTAFDSVTDNYTLFLFPLITGAFVASTSHWVSLLFGKLAQNPLERIDNLHLELENKKIIRQTELEQSRSTLFGIKEKELIDRAKRDEEVAEITDESVKEKLSEDLGRLREERDKLNDELNNSSKFKLSSAAIELLKAAATNKKGAILKPQTLGNRSIQAGGKSFGGKDQRDYKKYEAALDELESLDLVKDASYTIGMYELTHQGWEVSNEL